MNQTQPISRPLFIGLIVVAVVLVCFAGYYFFIAPPKAAMSDQAKKMYMQRMNSSPQSYTRPNMPASGGASSSGGQ